MRLARHGAWSWYRPLVPGLSRGVGAFLVEGLDPWTRNLP